VQVDRSSGASIEKDGLPMDMVATMDEASRRKMLHELDGKMKYAAPPYCAVVAPMRDPCCKAVTDEAEL
jgi:hypothetical protein